ncbi:hypothetical protein AAMO2058_001548200 [Amorphochlora amoebiformis]|uniref:Thioredoxin domain-containing protein n=1 Tax=Amorphochlora amoebiformis TaxID=1561963 RepID=A0A7S0H0Y5_9EUKA|mmetsp:Transcript_33326/g.53554  ORF Transcript_33326/g.53554 Transcript_33326/m.53554 type:complete len:457 (+) Transcript_33326:144-1514(+)
MQALKQFDFYKQIPSDFKIQTMGGGTISMMAAVFMTFLFTLELWSFISGYESTTIVVDQDSATSIWVNFNTTLPSTHCDHISVDVEDMLGTNVMDIQKNVEKIPLDENGVQLPDLDHSHHHAAPDGHVSEEENLIANEATTKENYEPVVLDKESFSKYVDSHEWVFVYFGASWCHWCQKLDPIWKAAGEVLKNRGAAITLPKVECTKDTSLCQEHQVHALPTIQLFHNGHLVPPNYRGPRTVNDLVHFAENAQLSKAKAEEANVANKGKKRGDVGCSVSGHLLVHRVPGSIQFSVKSGEHNFNREHINFTHIVHHFSFNSVPESWEHMLAVMEDDSHRSLVSKWYGRVFNSPKDHVVHEHYLKVVQNHIKPLGLSSENQVYEHTISSHSYVSEQLAHVRFHYDLSPMQIVKEWKRRPFYEFITNLLALIGGTFTVMGIVNEAYNGILAKASIGKLG